MNRYERLVELHQTPEPTFKDYIEIGKLEDELGYDIEQLYIDGVSEKVIATILALPLQYVNSWMGANGLLGVDILDNDLSIRA
jgi:hypothetical protein